MAISEVVVYGITNCDTVKKARRWLEQAAIDYTFHDFRKDGLSDEQIKIWYETLGVELLLNKKSSTWRQLDEAQQHAIVDVDSGVNLIKTSPTLIKRPLISYMKNDQVYFQVGFKPDQFQNTFL